MPASPDWRPGNRITAGRLALHPRLIERVKLTTSEPSVTFSAIPQTLRDLKLTIRARSTAAGDQTAALVRMNGISNNYATSLMQDFNSFASGPSTNVGAWYLTAQAGFHGGFTPAAGAFSTAFSSAEMTIPEYSDTGKRKMSICTGGYLDGTRHFAVWALSHNDAAAAITSLTIVPAAGSWATGSTFALTGYP